MRTLGIDLAAQDANTAWCAIEWRSGRARVEPPQVGRPAAEMLPAMQHADWIGIDAPFGWPEPMVDAVRRYADGQPWPDEALPERLRYRATDRFVHEVVARDAGVSVWPLSVSSDRIAVCAWRCARLLSEHFARAGSPIDRVGGGVAEVYPAAALALWGLPHKGYKRNSATPADVARTRRTAILAGLERGAGAWLELPGDVRATCLDSDHALDALLSGLVARAAATGLTRLPSPDQRRAAEREGWIHLPRRGSLEALGAAQPARGIA